MRSWRLRRDRAALKSPHPRPVPCNRLARDAGWQHSPQHRLGRTDRPEPRRSIATKAGSIRSSPIIAPGYARISRRPPGTPPRAPTSTACATMTGSYRWMLRAPYRCSTRRAPCPKWVGTFTDTNIAASLARPRESEGNAIARSSRPHRRPWSWPPDRTGTFPRSRYSTPSANTLRSQWAEIQHPIPTNLSTPAAWIRRCHERRLDETRRKLRRTAITADHRAGQIPYRIKR